MIKGRCHCNAVGWTFDGFPDSATACNCTVCRRYGTLWAYDWLDERVSTRGETAVYTHGDEGIGFHFCRTCGCVTWWQGVRPHTDGRTRIAVNLRMSESPDAVATLPIRKFDGLDSFTDLASSPRCVADIWF